MAVTKRKSSARSRGARPRTRAGADDEVGFTAQTTPDADLTWLLHRAAQQMRAAVGAEAERSDLQLRDYIVLSALTMFAPSTQLRLGLALGLDKTTLTLLLDRLEAKGLVVRRADPTDRRSRIPQATAAGRALQTKVAARMRNVEASLLDGFSATEERRLRLLLCQVIGVGEATVKGSCV